MVQVKESASLPSAATTCTQFYKRFTIVLQLPCGMGVGATMHSRFLLAIAFASVTAALSAQPLVVHEWGTFTSLQDEGGRTLSGINTDDEPVPAFCHDLAPRLVFRPDVAAWGPSQGAPRGHRDVTMRLETPVIYFHLPKGEANPLVA